MEAVERLIEYQRTCWNTQFVTDKCLHQWNVALIVPTIFMAIYVTDIDVLVLAYGLEHLLRLLGKYGNICHQCWYIGQDQSQDRYINIG